jgi:hypothetical protein
MSSFAQTRLNERAPLFEGLRFQGGVAHALLEYTMNIFYIIGVIVVVIVVAGYLGVHL